jgi:hypothetical protein
MLNTVFAQARSVVIEIGPNNQVGRLGRNNSSNPGSAWWKLLPFAVQLPFG